MAEEDDQSSPPSLPPAKFFNPGSDISLKCIIRRHLIQNATVKEIANVSWKHNGILLDLQSTERIRKIDIGPKLSPTGTFDK